MRDGLTDAIRIGTISSIDSDKCMAKVTFENRQDTTTQDLFVLVPSTLKDQAYYMPTVGERVRVIFDPEAPAKGYILGSYYADNRRPPIKDENKRYIMFEDKTLVEYDKKLHTLTVKILEGGDCSISIETQSDISATTKGKIEIGAESDISIRTSGNLIVDAAREITIKANAKLTITSSDDIDITSAKDLTLTGQTSSLTL